MNTREVVRRIRAFHQGRPLPRGETIHLPIVDDRDLLIVAFVRMGGEARPWGVVWGHPGHQPTVRVIPEARDRDLVAGMMAEFALVLLPHLRCPGHVTRTAASWEDLDPLRQVWLPNPSHLDMLHHLAYAYTFTRSGGARQQLLNQFGRACAWLFRESQRPGAVHVIVATEALRTSFTFPAEDVRQGHLGFLLAWLETRGGRDRRLAAAIESERRPIATGLDPSLERDELEPLVEGWRAARENAARRLQRTSERKLAEIIGKELRYRYELTARTISLLREDGRRQNGGISALIREGLKEQWYQYVRLERRIDDPQDGPAFIPSVETDRHPAAAGSRYQVHQASAALAESVLLHDDRELQAEAIADGEAFHGEIVDVRDEGKGRMVKPVWVVHDRMTHQMRLRPGSWVCVVGLPRRTATIRSIQTALDGGLLFELVITGLKTAVKGATGRAAIPPVDRRWIGKAVTFANAPADTIPRRKSQRIWRRDTPGGWLTHAPPGGPAARGDDESGNDVAAVVSAEAARAEEEER